MIAEGALIHGIMRLFHRDGSWRDLAVLLIVYGLPIFIAIFAVMDVCSLMNDWEIGGAVNLLTYYFTLWILPLTMRAAAASIGANLALSMVGLILVIL
jgi:hypothetical protein